MTRILLFASKLKAEALLICETLTNHNILQKNDFLISLCHLNTETGNCVFPFRNNTEEQHSNFAFNDTS